MEYTEIRYETGRVATILFDRPAVLNAITRELMAQATDAVHRAAASGEVRVVVLRGAGRAFSSGADLKAGAAGVGSEPFETFDRVYGSFTPLVGAIRACPKPVVAAVHGPAVGAGMSIALACDLLVASRSATFGQGFVKVGLCPDLGSFFFLPRAVGTARARELMLFGDVISAEEGLALGFVNRVFDDSSFEAALAAYCERLAEGAPRALATVKRLLDRAHHSDLVSLLGEEAVAQSLLRLTEDHREGVAAFREKRAPRFTGR
jgi:2-(1,2-epoxy-1,2-dihydrophenyl)acetyl-CoA isomerase